MADSKISDLTAQTTLEEANEFVLADSGVTKKITAANLRTGIVASTWIFASSYGASSSASAATNAVALQAAFDAAAGTPVILPPGTLDFDTTLTLNQGQHVIGFAPIGYGGTNGSVLNFEGGATDNAIQMASNDLSWVLLEGFKLTDGRTTPTSGDGLHLLRCKNGIMLRNMGVAFTQSSASNAIYIGADSGHTTENIDIQFCWVFGGQYGIHLERYDNNCRVVSVYGDSQGANTMQALVYLDNVSGGQSPTVIENLKLETNTGCDVLQIGSGFSSVVRASSLSLRGPTQGLGGYVINNQSDNAHVIASAISTQPGFTTGPGLVALALVNDRGTLWYEPFATASPRPRDLGSFVLQAKTTAPHTIVGGQAVSYREVNLANATLDSRDYVLGVVCGGSDRTVTLPPIPGDASTESAPGRLYKIRKLDAGVGRLLLAATAGDSIDGGTSIASDLFTDTDATALTSHTPDGGGTWTEHSSYSSGDTIVSDANRIRSNSANANVVYHSASPTNADYDVECDVYFASGSSDHAGIVGRVATGADTYYGLRVTTSGGTVELFKVVAGSSTSLATWSSGYSSGTTHKLKLMMRGTALSGYADGVLRVSATDSDISAAGKAGVRVRQTTTNSTGVHIDNFYVYDPALSYEAAAASATGGIEVVADTNMNAWRITGSF